MPCDIRPLYPEERQLIADTLRELLECFSAWRKNYEGVELDLIGFAFYESCPDSGAHYAEILARAAPFALGKRLVESCGFDWVAMRDGQEDWYFGIAHPAMDSPINLQRLEDGHLSERTYDEPPYRGERTYDSYQTIKSRVSPNR